MTMQANNKRAFGGFRPLVDFLDRHPVESASADVKANRDALDGVITRMTALTERREVSRAESTAQTRAYEGMRRRLEREFLTPVRRLTRVIAGNNEALSAILRPRRQRDLVAQVAAARAVATAARDHAEAFTKAGLKPDYAATLTALLDELMTFHESRVRRRAELAGVVVALQTEAKRGRFIVGLLDGVLGLLLERDPALLQEWRTLRRRVTLRVRESVEGDVPVAPDASLAQARAA